MITALFENIHITLWLIGISSLIFLGLMTQVFIELKQKQQLNLGFWLIILLGLALRLLWIIATQPTPQSDFLVYWQYAEQFARGDFSYDAIIRHPGPSILFYFAQLLFGKGLQAVWALNLLLSGSIFILMYALVNRLANQKTALFALGLTALFPQFITYTAIAGTEIMAIATGLAVFWLFLKLWEQGIQKQPNLWGWAALGLLLYGTALIRSSNLLYIGLIPLTILLFEKRQAFRWCLSVFTLIATTGILLSTWVYHQYLVTNGAGAKLFFGAELGFACAVQYDANHHYMNGAYMSPQKWSFYPKVAKYYASNTIEDRVKAYEYTGKEAMAIIRQDPARYLWNGFARMKRVLNTAQTGVRWSERGSMLVKHWHPKAIKRIATVSNVFWQILLYTAPLALVLYPWRKSTSSSQHVMILSLIYISSWYIFHLIMALSNERYGVQVIPFVIILFSVVVQQVFTYIQCKAIQYIPKQEAQEAV